MENNRKVVIITDSAAPTQEWAERIAAVIGGYPGYSAAVIPADSFSGDELLPAYAFFVGCEEAHPPSFVYLEALLGHINLAGRSCGIFSSNTKTFKYISSLVHDSEAASAKPFLAKDGAADGDELRNWIQSILQVKGEKNGHIQS